MRDMQKSQLIDVPTKKILAHIKEHPVIRYRQLLRLTGLSHHKMSRVLKKNSVMYST